jgi:hypothetical protein
MRIPRTRHRSTLATALGALPFALTLGAQAPTHRTVLGAAAMAEQHELLTKCIAAATARPFADGGLCGVHGAAKVRVGKNEVVLRLPMPQLAAGQVPILFAATATPPTALQELHVCHDATLGTWLEAAILGKNGLEVQLSWAAVVLLAERPEAASAEKAKPFLAPTPCAQSDHAAIAALATELAPASASVGEFAPALQHWVQRQVAKAQVKSMDALGLLASRNPGICTMNANLAVALLRHRGLPTRSLAVVPTTGQRVEMHRIVEWFTDGHWRRFDPSSLHTDVPMRTSQSIVVATTSIADEVRAGQPRLGSPIGCPFGHEIEIVRGLAMLTTTDFFWAQATPLVAFAADDRAVTAATTAWRHFLAQGTQAESAAAAAAATDLATFVAAWPKR